MKAVCLSVCALVVSAFAADAPLPSLLKTVEQRYNNAKTLQVLFREDYVRTGHAKRSESGTLDLRQPGRMRWEYSDPKGKLAVCDGKIFKMYTPSDNRVSQYSLKDTDDMRAPLAFLLGRLHFEKEFRSLHAKPEGADQRITAEPKNDNMPYSAVEFLVATDGRIREVKVTRFDSSVMVYTFDQEKVGLKLGDELFQFQAPKGAEVVEAER